VQTILAGEQATFSFGSGTGGDVVVADSSEPSCEARATVATHTCETPCNLPCRGITREVGYPMWVQRPEARTRLEYLEFGVGVKFFNIFLENGETIELDPAQLTEILTPSGSIRRNNYTQTWNRAIESINDLIKAVTEERLGVEYPLLTLTLDQERIPGLSALRIEHYECHRFEFNLGISYVSSLDEQTTFERSIVYTQQEFSVSERVSIDGQTIGRLTQGNLPAFNAILFDRCNPELPPRETCVERVSVDFQVRPLASRPGLDLIAQAPDNFPVLWIIEHAIPAMTSATRLQPQFRTGVIYQTLLLAVDPETNCVGLAAEPLSLGF
jgi:hypothetical protein